MTNSSGSGRAGKRGGRRIAVLVSVASAAALGVMLFGASSASASLVNCGGTVQPQEKGKPSIDAKFSLQCNADIRAFSLTTNKKFDFFGEELLVYEAGKESQQSALLQCEGNFPGSGFGCGTPNRNTPSNCGTPNGVACTNRVTAGNVIVGEVGFPRSPCRYKATEDKLKIWLTVVTEPIVTPQGAAATTGLYSSEPFKLKVKGYSASACASAAAGKKS